MAEVSEARGVESREGGGWGLPVALILLALVLLLVVSRSRPPEPKAADVPVNEFSAGRAQAVLKELVGDGAPHPVGSAANARVRERILAQLRWLGYQPEVQEDFSCGTFGDCARVSNVIARLEGRKPGKTILLMAHYDSVGAGPGVSDDLAGVAAILEIARILKAGPQPRNTILFLLDDGEEGFLLGAEAFDRSPAARDVAVVLNLEARGAGGPSILFETSGDDAWMIPLFASQVERPLTSSIFATIYDALPNDTDLSVFKRRDLPGLNFAFIDRPTLYHTSKDNLENLSPASLQHHGDNSLAAVRAFAGADLDAPRAAGDAVFFDLLGTRVIHWPMSWNLILAVLALVLVIAAVVLARRGGSVSVGAILNGLVVLPAALVFAAAAGFGLQSVLNAAFPTPWVAQPLPAIAAFWLIPLAVSLWAASLLARRSNARGLWAGTWIWWALLGLVLCFVAPGISYLFVVPALVAGLLGLVAFAPRGRSAVGLVVASIVPALGAGALWFPIVFFLYAGLGLLGLLVTAALLAIFFTVLAPLVGAAGPGLRKWTPVALGAPAVLLGLLAMVSPPFSEASPRQMVFQFQQNNEGVAQWIVRGAAPLPQAVRDAVPFDNQPKVPFPGARGFGFTAKAPLLEIPVPQIAVLENTYKDGLRRLRVRVTSPRGAPVISVLIPPAAKVKSVKVQGREVPIDPEYKGLRSFTDLTHGPGGTELEVVLEEYRSFNWFVVDRSPGLPPGGEALLKARPKDAVEYQDGDVTFFSSKVWI
jgi:hypothetical protein